MSDSSVSPSMVESGYHPTWLLYFDILGFKNMVASSIGPEPAFHRLLESYRDTLAELTRLGEKKQGFKIEHQWFSDSFVVWIQESTPSAFTIIHQIAWQFLWRSLMNEVPMRGAIAYGDFFAEHDGRTFFGPALVEAHGWSEQLDGIGYLICPSARVQLESAKYALPSLNYIAKRIPLKICVADGTVAAYNYWSLRPQLPQIRDVLNRLLLHAPLKAKRKYRNTLKLIKNCHKHLEPHP